MKWIGISGSWRKMNKELENDVRKTVKNIIAKGDGIVSGGALNVDYIATDEALHLNPSAERIKIFLPTTLKIYSAHYKKRAKEGVITEKQAKNLINQLNKLKNKNPNALIENKQSKIVNTETYYQRNSEVVKASDKLMAFYVNGSRGGIKDTITKAEKKGIPVKVNYYIIE